MGHLAANASIPDCPEILYRFHMDLGVSPRKRLYLAKLHVGPGERRRARRNYHATRRRLDTTDGELGGAVSRRSGFTRIIMVSAYTNQEGGGGW